MKTIYKIIFGIFLGIIPAVLIIKENRDVKKATVTPILEFLEKKWNARVKLENVHISLLSGKIKIKNLTISSKQKHNSKTKKPTCRWKCKNCTITVQPKDSISQKKLFLHIDLKNNTIESEFSGKNFGITNLLQSIFTHNPDNINVNSFKISNTKMIFKNKKTKAPPSISNSTSKPIIFAFNGDFLIKKDLFECWHGNFSTTNGQLSIGSKTLFSKLCGSAQFDESKNGFFAKIKKDFFTHFFQKDKGITFYERSTNLEHFSISGKYDTKKIDITLSNKAIPAKASLKIFLPKSQKKPLHGTLTIPNITSLLNPTHITSKVQPSTKVPLPMSDYIFDFRLENKTGNHPPRLFFSNKNTIQFPQKFDLQKNYAIYPGDLNIKIFPQKRGTPHGGTLYFASYNIKTTHIPTKKTLTTTGKIGTKKKSTVSPSMFVIDGTLFSKNTFCATITKNFDLHNIVFFKKQKTKVSPSTVAKIKKSNPEKKKASPSTKVSPSTKTSPSMRNCINYSGFAHYKFLRQFLPQKIRRSLMGNKGILHFSINSQKGRVIFQCSPKYFGKINFSKGKIKLPGHYNVITDFSTNIEYHPSSTNKGTTLHDALKLSDTIIQFRKGKLFSNTIKIENLSNQGTKRIKSTCRKIFCDLQIDDLLINIKNDFFGIIKGNFFIDKNISKRLSIIGDIIIKKSLLKENIFSQSTNSNFSLTDIPFLPQVSPATKNLDININISNEDDLIVKTPFLQAKATTDLNIQFLSKPNKIPEPRIKGSITLRQGTLQFPQNELFLTSGKITFIPTQINNPMIDLTAQNRIKKYILTLHISGPSQNPTIILESTPELNNEQIIALLFAGSEEINLQSQFPAIVMQNLSTFILGSNKLSPITNSFFKKLTTPLKYVQITPDFTNQSGRGGIKGTIAVDINKKLHARIQKNFSMQEDFAFQLEYFLSDDFNIKAVKDHRGDLGAEIEWTKKI